MISFIILLIASTARIACADRQTDRHTHTQDNYCNPRCACAPRVNNAIDDLKKLPWINKQTHNHNITVIG